MRRSAVSIASNIAEGTTRQGTEKFVQFLYNAVGSENELDTQLEISKVVKMAETERLEAVQAPVTTAMILRG